MGKKNVEQHSKLRGFSHPPQFVLMDLGGFRLGRVMIRRSLWSA